MFSTTIWFVAMSVVTDMTKIRYLRKTKNRPVLETVCDKRRKHPAEVGREHTDSLANERHRERGLRDLLSDEDEEDSLSEQDGDCHRQLLSTGCEGERQLLYLKVTYYATSPFSCLLYIKMCPRCVRELTKCQKTKPSLFYSVPKSLKTGVQRS